MAGMWLYGSIHIIGLVTAYDGWFVMGVVVPLVYLAIATAYLWTVKDRLKD